MAYYIDCDYIVYEYTEEYIKSFEDSGRYKAHRCIHRNLNDYESKCNSGLWRDGSFGNALIALQHQKITDALHVFKDGKEILTITRDTYRNEYERR